MIKLMILAMIAAAAAAFADAPPIHKITCYGINGENLLDHLAVEVYEEQQCASAIYYTGTYNCPRGDGYHPCTLAAHSTSTCGLGPNWLSVEVDNYRLTTINISSSVHWMPRTGEGHIESFQLQVVGDQWMELTHFSAQTDLCDSPRCLFGDFILPEHMVGANCIVDWE